VGITLHLPWCRDNTAHGSLDFVARVLLVQPVKDLIQVCVARLLEQPSTRGIRGSTQNLHHPFGQFWEIRQTSWHRYASAAEEDHVTAIALFQKFVRDAWSLGDKAHIDLYVFLSPPCAD
jgi:hypothetical protein